MLHILIGRYQKYIIGNNVVSYSHLSSNGETTTYHSRIQSRAQYEKGYVGLGVPQQELYLNH
jgi:hypothetical protein